MSKQEKLYKVLLDRFLSTLSFTPKSTGRYGELLVTLPSDFHWDMRNETYGENVLYCDEVESWDYYSFPIEDDTFDNDFIKYFNQYGLTDIEKIKLLFRRFVQHVKKKNEEFHDGN